ncbi:amino acid permease [Phyllobacterium phragmitis]|uniref:Amino acid permease n=1 Tax=Phyllobacterium phragmitis TaxID=2670329 RepID=A0A2S9IWB6_9HYPH|nr:APC family permease [Phyllobacterium phragmitis]PRD44780.1 amino acid permease [Phyllobacterium phragmitis]
MKREMGLIGLMFVAVSAVLGSGWLFAPLLASEQAGPAAIIAWGIGGIAMLLIALTFAEISAMLPVPGGIARVPQFSHGNVVAMAMGWSAWIGYNTTAPIEVEAMLRYLAPHLGWISGDMSDWPTLLLAAGFLALFTLINAVGVQFFSRVNSALTWVKIAIPLVIIVTLMWARFDTANFSSAGGFSPYGLHGIFAAVSTGGIIFSFIGFRHVIDMAGEVHRPGVTVPLALILSVVICFVIYGSLQLAFVGAMPSDMLSNGWNGLLSNAQLGPIEAIATSLGLLWLVSLLNVGAVLGPFGGGLVATGSNARLAYALSRNGFFPKILTRLSKRRIPLLALLVNFVFSTLVFLLMPFQEIVQLNSSAIVLSFVVGPVTVVALRRLLPDQPRPLRLPALMWIAAPAFVVATLIIYWSGWDTLWRLGLALLAGLVLFLIHARLRSPGKLDFREATWLVPYFAGIGIFSYLGTFGGKGILPFGWDIAAITVFSLAVFVLAIACRLPAERCAEQIKGLKSIRSRPEKPA